MFAGRVTIYTRSQIINYRICIYKGVVVEFGIKKIFTLNPHIEVAGFIEMSKTIL